MLWILLGLIAAFFESTKNVLRKKISKTYPPIVIGWYSTVIALVILILPNFFIQIPKTSNLFWVSLIIAGTINAFTLILIIKALKETELSLVSPLFSFSPAFVLISAIFFLGEIPALLGIIGVGLIIIGSLIINIKKHNNPLKNLLKDKGQKKMLLATILWAISSNYYKLGMQETNPYFFVMSLYIFVAIVLLPFAYKKLTKPNKEIILLGVLTSFVSLAQWLVVNLTLLAYALSLKRLSVVFSLIFAKKIFKEKNMKWKIIGTVVMLIGVGLIIL